MMNVYKYIHEHELIHGHVQGPVHVHKQETRQGHGKKCENMEMT